MVLGVTFDCHDDYSLFILFYIEQLVFRTVGYSGADIRNLVNEATIMSVSQITPNHFLVSLGTEDFINLR